MFKLLLTTPISVSQIFPNGSLNVQRLSEGDQGGYTCSVANNFGSDQIMYELIVQVNKKQMKTNKNKNKPKQIKERNKNK